VKFIASVIVLSLAAGASGQQIIGGSSILSQGDVQTLEGWLGEGIQSITNIFDYTMGDGQGAAAFHAAADSQGRTFTVVRDTAGIVFGGYNPQSWDSFGDYNYVDDNNRNAWLFNLTNGAKIAQLQDGDFGLGQYQTYNGSTYGPTFGGGHDLYVGSDNGDWGNGYSYGFSYGNVMNGNQFEQYDFQVAEMEVFTITVPAPGAGALLGIGGLLAARRRR
jgi:hypothetical protein